VPKSISGVGCFSRSAFEVDRILWRRWLQLCLLIASSAKPDEVIRCLSLNDYNIADFVGLNKALCK
jgi:hypothetical protein